MKVLPAPRTTSGRNLAVAKRRARRGEYTVAFVVRPNQIEFRWPRRRPT